MDRLSRECECAPTRISARACVCACPALFLRLQFELKKAVDTRTIGCAAAASSSSPPSPDPPGYFSHPPAFLQNQLLILLLFLAVSFSSSFLLRLDDDENEDPDGDAPRAVLVTLYLSWTNTDSLFRPRGILSSSFQTLRSNATSSLNTLTLSIIMSPAKQSLFLLRIPSSSRSRSRDFRVFVGFSLCSISFIRAFPPFPQPCILGSISPKTTRTIAGILLALSNVESDIMYARPKPRSLSSLVLPPPPRRFLFHALSLHDAIFLLSEIRGRSP